MPIALTTVTRDLDFLQHIDIYKNYKEECLEYIPLVVPGRCRVTDCPECSLADTNNLVLQRDHLPQNEPRLMMSFPRLCATEQWPRSTVTASPKLPLMAARVELCQRLTLLAVPSVMRFRKRALPSRGLKSAFDTEWSRSSCPQA